ncbi:hypothetical protein ABC383_23640 [Noviherbaspirillum sp. 1P10PC]|uniref:hypothetical protein n=1 Tax=Noviherbaspirillum sp. 1P10PC TaxID=3132292 RepID=UPI0039A2F8D3
MAGTAFARDTAMPCAARENPAGALARQSGASSCSVWLAMLSGSLEASYSYLINGKTIRKKSEAIAEIALPDAASGFDSDCIFINKFNRGKTLNP